MKDCSEVSFTMMLAGLNYTSLKIKLEIRVINLLDSLDGDY